MNHTARNATLAIILILLFIVSGVYLYSALYTRPEGSASSASSPSGSTSSFSPFSGRSGATPVSGAADIRYAAPATDQPGSSSAAYRFSGYPQTQSPSGFYGSDSPSARSQAISGQSFFSNASALSNASANGSSQNYYSQAGASSYAASYPSYYSPTYDQYGNPVAGSSTGSQSPSSSGSSGSGSGVSVLGGVIGSAGGALLGGQAGFAAGTLVTGDPVGGMTTGSFIGGVAGGVAGSLGTSLLGGLSGGFGGGSGGGAGGINGNFGGRVTNVTYCTCDASIMLDIDDVRGQTKELIYMPGVSTIYANYNVYGTGQEVLGTYTQGGSCLVYEGEDCNTQGNPDGTISKIGTSME